MITPEELRHVLEGPRPRERPGGAGLIAVTFEAEHPQDVVVRSREVLAVVLAAPAQQWPTLSAWSDSLPAWFVSACAAERSDEEYRAWLAWWRGLDPAAREKAERETQWTLSAWLSWLEPEDREWYWWDAAADGQAGTVFVEVPGWPAPLGALNWLLRAGGAVSVTTDQP